MSLTGFAIAFTSAFVAATGIRLWRRRAGR